jgi:hypothetical protein
MCVAVRRRPCHRRRRYGARAKLIQNDASRNVENKVAERLKAPIQTLKGQIERLKRGEVRRRRRAAATEG